MSSNLFVTTETKPALSPILSSPNKSTVSKDVSVLSGNQKALLSVKAGIPIKSDSDLARAKATVIKNYTSENFNLNKSSPLFDLSKVSDLGVSVSKNIMALRDVIEPIKLTIAGIVGQVTTTSKTIMHAKNKLDEAIAKHPLYKKALNICEGLNLPDLDINYLQNKLEFEFLIDLGISTNDWDFLSGLADCTKLFDNYTKKTFLDQANALIDVGNVKGFAVTVAIVGPDEIVDKKTKLLRIGAKMPKTSTPAEQDEQVLSFMDLMAMFDMSGEQLTTSSAIPRRSHPAPSPPPSSTLRAIDIQAVSKISAKNPKVGRASMGDDNKWAMTMTLTNKYVNF